MDTGTSASTTSGGYHSQLPSIVLRRGAVIAHIQTVSSSNANPFLRRFSLIGSRQLRKMAEAQVAADQNLHREASAIIYELNNAGRMQNVYDLRDLLPSEVG